MPKPSLLIIAILSILMHLHGFGQHTLKLAGHRYKINKFIKDTIDRPIYLSDITAPPPIKQSVYDLEIRYYSLGLPGYERTVAVIKGSKDSLYAEQYEIYVVPARYQARKVLMKNKTILYMTHKRLTNSTVMDTLVKRMILYHLFDITDQHKTYEGLKSKHVNVNYITQPNDCCGDEYIEVGRYGGLDHLIPQTKDQ